MPEQIDPIKTLKAARHTLVLERRGLAVAMALGHRRRRTDNPQTNEVRESFIVLQSTIEAIDRAIAHERLIEDEPVEVFTLPTHEPAANGDSIQKNMAPGAAPFPIGNS